MSIADVFDQFLDESFDAKQYASVAIQSRVVGESLEKLAAGIQKLDKELYSQAILSSYTWHRP